MRLVFLHGWSVTSTDTYGGLPEAIQAAAIAQGIEIDVQHIYLGRYISFHDEVRMDDLVRAFDYALRSDIPDNVQIGTFSCITHSTGGPLLRRWIDLFYGPEGIGNCPLQHAIMLAPANHGSALALLGKERVGRIKAWFGGVEPGQGVLDWLCLGSEEGWALQQSFTKYQFHDSGFYPFVLTGQAIDEKFYDFLNSYLAEVGSDGVVRVAAANLNYSYFRLNETRESYPPDGWERGEYEMMKLEVDQGASRRSPFVPLGIIPKASHSGEKMGIMRSVTPRNTENRLVVAEIVKCLQVNTAAGYTQRGVELAALTMATQADEKKRGGKDPMPRCAMLIFQIRDDRGRVISDYDMFLLGNEYHRDKLPSGFFIDRQKNPQSQALVYYMNYDELRNVTQLGFQIVARPVIFEGEKQEADAVLAGYKPAEFRIATDSIRKYINPNETVYVEIVLNRHVDSETTRLDPLSSKPNNFKDKPPSGKLIRNR